ncbi:hypothetical protein DERP_006653 [Dermatophagoides pteronyssinus]|uniref:Uncharacterized protein n=1 Tax=Dermatophagoides pteronyssinus TaxID=6956 RepID=A0ABQ8IQT9_DERPT|nr:hypothetical protein DERP_006653 [Dermatophagoides pteronyssinus]
MTSNINSTAYSNGITGNSHGNLVLVGISIPVPLIPNGQTVVKRIWEFSSNSSYIHFIKPTTACLLALLTQKCAIIFTSKISRIFSDFKFLNGSHGAIPALFTRISKSPNCCRNFCAAFSTCSSLRTSTTNQPIFFIKKTLKQTSLISHRIVMAPAPANFIANSRPNPEPAPVINTTLFWTFFLRLGRIAAINGPANVFINNIAEYI